jgi:predicted nucleotidyltransferase
MDALWVIEAGHCPCRRWIGAAVVVGVPRRNCAAPGDGLRPPDSTNVRESGMLVAVHRAGFLEVSGGSTMACRSIPARADTDNLLKLHSWRSGGRAMTNPSTIDTARARPGGEPAG